MNCLPWIFFWFAGLPSQKWVCPSMTKISSPLAVLYMAFLLLPLGLSVMRLAVGVAGLAWPAPMPAKRCSQQSSNDVSHHLVHVAEQHDGVVIRHDHAAVMRRGGNFEEMRGHHPTQLLRNLVHLEFHFAVAIDADHGGHVRHPDMIVAAHNVGNSARLDAVVHRDSTLMRHRVFECDVFHRFEDVVIFVQHVDLLKGWVKRRGVGYDERLAGTFRPSSAAIPLMRFFACTRASPNVAILTRGCDQIGCR